jgi:hypothetical protein
VIKWQAAYFSGANELFKITFVQRGNEIKMHRVLHPTKGAISPETQASKGF